MELKRSHFYCNDLISSSHSSLGLEEFVCSLQNSFKFCINSETLWHVLLVIMKAIGLILPFIGYLAPSVGLDRSYLVCIHLSFIFV